MRTPKFIAEIKTQSMYGYGYRATYSRHRLIETALTHGDVISVHTDPRFGGSFDDIALIRKETKKPILAKGFHAHDSDVQKALDLGADYVLVVDRVPDIERFTYRMMGKFLIELSNLNSCENDVNRLLSFEKDFRQDYGLKFVYNGRDLKTGLGKKYIGDYTEYRKKFKWVCGASLLRSREDVDTFYPDCDAFIVGTNLVEFCQTL